MSRRSPLRALCPAIAAVAWLVVTVPAEAQDRGPLFPAAFAVEHRVVQIDADGTVFATEPVKDTYGGSWIVSERADGSRLVIDFARREIIEIRPAEGRYSVIGFDRMAQLLRELDALEGAPAVAEKASAEEAEPELRVIELDGPSGVPEKRAMRGDRLAERPGVRHLRVLRDDPKAGDETVLDAWFDPAFRFSARALEAVDGFEREVLAAGGPAAGLGQKSLALARREAGGALAVLTLRPMVAGDRSAGIVEDVASRLEIIDSMPTELVTVPDGLRRTPHALELMVAHAEQEAELEALMGGGS